MGFEDRGFNRGSGGRYGRYPGSGFSPERAPPPTYGYMARQRSRSRDRFSDRPGRFEIRPDRRPSFEIRPDRRPGRSEDRFERGRFTITSPKSGSPNAGMSADRRSARARRFG